MQFLEIWYWAIDNRVRQSFSDSVEYSLPHVFYLGLVGFIGFPLYYWVWLEAFPQPYENLELRILGSILALGLMLIKVWPTKLRRYVGIYWLFTVTYALPFFFTYMLLMNEGNIVWAMSTMAGLTLLILVAYDWVLATIIFFVGSCIAFLAYALMVDQIILPSNYLIQLPIYLFLVVAGSIFNYKSVRLKQEKLKVLASVGADICHELRTPLITIKNDVYGLKHYLPKLLHGYQLAQENNLIAKPVRFDKFQALEQAVQRIEKEVSHSNTVIDMLLMNLSRSKVDIKQFEHFWMAEVIDQAIQRYPFDSELERNKIIVNSTGNFKFLGSDILMIHVIFNLLKNALLFTHNNTDAQIEITLEQDKKNNYLYFKDNGQGISLRDRHAIFENFYSSGNQVNSTGTGVGLAFCKKVLAYFNAKIDCHSKPGEYTEFVLSFPSGSA